MRRVALDGDAFRKAGIDGGGERIDQPHVMARAREPGDPAPGMETVRVGEKGKPQPPILAHAGPAAPFVVSARCRGGCRTAWILPPWRRR